MTPLLWPVWCAARVGSASSTTTPHAAAARQRHAGGRPDDPAADDRHVPHAASTLLMTPPPPGRYSGTFPGRHHGVRLASTMALAWETYAAIMAGGCRPQPPASPPPRASPACWPRWPPRARPPGRSARRSRGSTCGAYEAVPSGVGRIRTPDPPQHPEGRAPARDGERLDGSPASTAPTSRTTRRPNCSSTSYSGGAHCCETLRVWALELKAPRKILEYEAGNAGGFDVRDLDGDGRLELLLGDDSFAYFDDLSYALLPAPLPAGRLPRRGGMARLHPAVPGRAAGRPRGLRRAAGAGRQRRRDTPDRQGLGARRARAVRPARRGGGGPRDRSAARSRATRS